jgi:hypothetical protein
LRYCEGYKPDLYNAALVCRQFSMYAIPLLWRNFTFTLYEGDKDRPPYQTKLLETLSPESSKNFVYTRNLVLQLSMGGTSINNLSQGAAILATLEQFLQLYQHINPYLQNLDLKVEPFIPTDCAHDGLWPILNCCNDRIYHLIGRIMAKDSGLKSLSLEVGREAWQYEGEFRPHVQQILWMLGPKITALRISEDAQFLSLWLPTMPQLRNITAVNVGIDFDSSESTSLWRAISRLSVVEACLIDFPLPSQFPSKTSSTITHLCLRGLDDIVTACVVCYTQFPHLNVCSLNEGRVKDIAVARSAVIEQTVCTKLTQVHLLNSFAPKGLIRVVAKSNPDVNLCGAPKNTSDDDLHSLAMYCKKLRILDLSQGNPDEITPQTQLTKSGLDHIAAMRQLRILSLDYRHASLLDTENLCALAINLPFLWLFDFSFPKRGIEIFCRTRIRAALSGTEEFKDKVFEHVREGEYGRNPWQISLKSLLASIRSGGSRL